MKKMKCMTAFATWTTTLILAGTSHAALITFQQGVANDFTGAGVYEGVEDTSLNGGNPTVNFGTGVASSVAVRFDGALQHLLLRFNLGDLPTGSTVTGDATLNMRTNTGIVSGNGFGDYEVLGASGSWQELSSTWNELNNSGAGTDWAGSRGASTEGTDYDGTLLDSVTTVLIPNAWMELTIP